MRSDGSTSFSFSYSSSYSREKGQSALGHCIVLVLLLELVLDSPVLMAITGPNSKWGEKKWRLSVVGVPQQPFGMAGDRPVRACTDPILTKNDALCARNDPFMESHHALVARNDPFLTTDHALVACNDPFMETQMALVAGSLPRQTRPIPKRDRRVYLFRRPKAFRITAKGCRALARRPKKPDKTPPRSASNRNAVPHRLQGSVFSSHQSLTTEH